MYLKALKAHTTTSKHCGTYKKSLVCALIYTTSTPLEIGSDIANSWEYYSAFAGYSHLHIIKAACRLTGAPLSDFTINLISPGTPKHNRATRACKAGWKRFLPALFFLAQKNGSLPAKGSSHNTPTKIYSLVIFDVSSHILDECVGTHVIFICLSNDSNSNINFAILHVIALDNCFILLI